MDYVFLIVIGIVIAVAIYYLYIEINDIRKAFVEFKSLIGLEHPKKTEKSNRKPPKQFDPLMMGGNLFCHAMPEANNPNSTNQLLQGNNRLPFSEIDDLHRKPSININNSVHRDGLFPETQVYDPNGITRSECLSVKKNLQEKKIVSDDGKIKFNVPSETGNNTFLKNNPPQEEKNKKEDASKPNDNISMVNHDGNDDDDLEDYETKSEDIPEYIPYDDEEKSPEIEDDDEENPYEGTEIEPVDEEPPKDKDDKELGDITDYDLKELRKIAKENKINISYHDKKDGKVKKYRKEQLYKILAKALPSMVTRS